MHAFVNYQMRACLHYERCLD